MSLADRAIQRMLDVVGDAVVRFNGTTAKGILRTTDEDAFSAEAASIAGRVRRLTIRTGTFVALVPGAQVEVNGVLRTVLQTRLRDDGRLTDVLLSDEV